MMDKISIYATTMNVNKLNIPKFSQVRIVINHNFELKNSLALVVESFTEHNNT